MATIFVKGYDTEVDFPDDTSPAVMQAALAKHFPVAAPSGATRTWKDTPEPGTLETAWDYAGELGRQTETALINYFKGKSDVKVSGDLDAYDAYAQGSLKASEEFLKEHGTDEPSIIPGFSKKDIAESVGNFPFSIISAAHGLGAGLGTLAVTKNPMLAWTAGGAAAGAAGYRIDSAQIMRAYLDTLNDAYIAAYGSPMTEAEQESNRKKFSSEATKHGLWEAIPEALGNVGALGIIIKPLRKTVGKVMAKKLMEKMGSNFFTNVLGKATGAIAVETATEAVSQQGQQPIEVRAGMQPGPERSLLSLQDWLTSYGEIFKPTLLIMGVMGGAAGGVVHVSGRKKAAAVNDLANSGGLPSMPDEILSKSLQAAENIKESRPWDKKLAQSVETLRAEAENRTAKAPPEPQAGAPAPPPPGTPSAGPKPGAPAPLGRTEKLSPEFFRDVKKALTDGVDKDGNPFTDDDARGILEAYRAGPGADPVSVRVFEMTLGEAKAAPMIDVPESIGQPLPEGPEQTLSGFRTFLESGPEMDAITAQKDDLLSRHPGLADDINKAIIEHEGSKLGKVERRGEERPEGAPAWTVADRMQLDLERHGPRIAEAAPQPGTPSFIQNRIRQLGSIEAVNRVYSTDSKVDQYARDMAEIGRAHV